MICQVPLDAPVLVDYWLALLPEAESEEVEEHLLSCDGCGASLRHAIVLIDGVRRLARDGTLRLVVTEDFVQRGIEQGLQVRQYNVVAGGSVHCTVTEDDDWLISRLSADVAGSDRVDLSLSGPDGVERMRLTDVPISRERDGVIYQESMAFAKASGTQTLRLRLIGVGEEGERVLAEYAFHHTRSLPGPGISMF
jgi:hypothetical protein